MVGNGTYPNFGGFELSLLNADLSGMIALRQRLGFWIEDGRVKRPGRADRIEELAYVCDVAVAGAEEDDVVLTVRPSNGFDTPLGHDFRDCTIRAAITLRHFESIGVPVYLSLSGSTFHRKSAVSDLSPLSDEPQL